MAPLRRVGAREDEAASRAPPVPVRRTGKIRRRFAGHVTNGRAVMNIRSVTFDLIARDVALRAFRVTDAVRVHPAHSTGSTAPESCFIELEWAVSERMVAPDGSLFLTVRAHLPCRRSAEHLLLDFLLQRVQMVLAAGAADGLIRSWYQGTLRDVAKS